MRITTNGQTKYIHVQQGATGACEHSRVNILVRKPYHASFSILSFFLLCCCDTAPHHDGAIQSILKQRYVAYKNHEQNRSPNTQFWILCFQIVVCCNCCKSRHSHSRTEAHPLYPLFSQGTGSLLNMVNWPSPQGVCVLSLACTTSVAV